MMRVHSVQAIAHIQDLGRFGLRRFGIGHAGAMDTLALQAGNLLLQNNPSAAALEIALGGISVSFTQDTPFCITGALYQADLDGEAIHSYWRYTAKRGQILTLTRAVQGMYGYLCVAGGFNTPAALGSCSTDLKTGFGGFKGRCLRAGDEIAIGQGARKLSKIGIAPIALTNRIHALPSSEYEAFTPEAHRALWSQSWTLQSNSNRMGYRLQGGNLTLREPLEMLSHAVAFGTVQAPPSGSPIVLMADAQTTGGYPKIAAVAAADLGRLAQIRFGSPVYFQRITPAQAAYLQRKNQVYLNQIKKIANDAS
ncbi:biotin-dependent carboxyltransferase family protein [Neisseria sp. S1]|uniref:5-oxoprolinase subunit C family protein n=1 Tax=Neisseria sp. S1 TaxID=3318354 RepID=UPI003A8633B5